MNVEWHVKGEDDSTVQSSWNVMVGRKWQLFMPAGWVCVFAHTLIHTLCFHKVGSALYLC